MLRARGHLVLTPTQAGIGERAYLLRAGIAISGAATRLRAAAPSGGVSLPSPSYAPLDVARRWRELALGHDATARAPGALAARLEELA